MTYMDIVKQCAVRSSACPHHKHSRSTRTTSEGVGDARGHVAACVIRRLIMAQWCFGTHLHSSKAASMRIQHQPHGTEVAPTQFPQHSVPTILELLSNMYGMIPTCRIAPKRVAAAMGKGCATNRACTIESLTLPVPLAAFILAFRCNIRAGIIALVVRVLGLVGVWVSCGANLHLSADGGKQLALQGVPLAWLTFMGPLVRLAIGTSSPWTCSYESCIDDYHKGTQAKLCLQSAAIIPAEPCAFMAASDATGSQWCSISIASTTILGC